MQTRGIEVTRRQDSVAERPRRVAPSTVTDNNWRELKDVAAVGGFDPSLRVSVVIPYYNRQAELALTLAALTEQTYPTDLLEVIVADDGSDEPPEIARAISESMSVKVVGQERRGFGTPRARNLGVRHSTGDLIVFLDSDMIPVREHIEAHARWHHAAKDAVTVGRRMHADFDHVSASQLSEAVRDGAIDDLVSDQGILEPVWIADYLESTDFLVDRPSGHWRIMSGGNLGVSRTLYDEVGGSDESFTQWGGEDNELGFRLVQAGALIVPEQDALCWHQGEGHEPDADELESLRMQRTRLRDLIADPDFRGRKDGRSYSVPYVMVSIPATETSPESISRCVDAVLASQIRDLVVCVDVTKGTKQREWLHREFAGDPRVVFSDTEPEIPDLRWTPIRISMPPSALPLPGSIEAVVKQISSGTIDTLYLTVPGAPPTDALISATTARAMYRSRRLAEASDSDFAEHGRWRREKWDVGGKFDIASNNSPDLVLTRSSRSAPDVNQIAALVNEMYDYSRDLARCRSRRSVQCSNSLGRVARSRSVRELLIGLSHAWQALGSPKRFKPEGRSSIAKRFAQAFRSPI